ncbi:MAG: hypothetical protein IBJ10_11670 [Phycisphaerales bacterium]|nr:hypothetical protein [Phycisphaerales bacterium]
MVRFACPNCGVRLEVDSGFRGSVARCDKCGALIHIPTKKGRRPGQPTAAQRPKTPSPLTPGPAPSVPTAHASERKGRRTWLLALGIAVLVLGGAGAALWLTGVRP